MTFKEQAPKRWSGFQTVTIVTDGGDVFGAGYAQATVDFAPGLFGGTTPVTQVTIASGQTWAVGATCHVTADSPDSVTVRVDMDPRNPGGLGKTIRLNVIAELPS